MSSSADMTPAELFTAVGRALYGDEFVAPIAAKLGIERNTVGIIQDRERETQPLPALRVAVLELAEPKE